MKTETRTFYETAVERAVLRIVASLDDALDLSALAKHAALSPFHFHRIFRGMLGETPLEMHRRLRLERAARQLRDSEVAVTTIAFNAGYETHEAFTRAFRSAYALSPSAFRQHEAGSVELAAPSGVHLSSPNLHFNTGESNMNVTVETKPELRVAAVAHVGPYNKISEAFARLGELAAGLLPHAEAMIAIYYDDPDVTPVDELRSDAALVVRPGVPLPEGMVEKHLPAGRYARTLHLGPYTGLGEAWARFMGEWLPKSGHRVGEASSYELYRNTPGNAAPEDLRTELYLPIA